MNVEEALREIREKSAVLRHLASSVAFNPEIPDPDVFAGIAGMCAEIEQRTRMIAGAVPVDVLATEIRAQRRR